MVGEMVQNSQSLYSFTFNALIDIHEYIYSHSTTEFTFKKYIYSHLPVHFLFTIIFAHIYEMSSFTFNELYSFTFTTEIFIQHFLRITFAYLSVKIWTTDYGLGIKHRLRYKRRTKHYGLGIKYGLRYKTRSVRYRFGIKHEERFYKLNKFSHERFYK